MAEKGKTETAIKSESEQEEEEEEEYEGDDPRKDVLELLQEVETPGTFVVAGMCDSRMTMPGLVVDGVGPIGLPLSEALAHAVAARCEQAPFGRGSETLVDTTVRNTKQLPPEAFQIQNPQWDEYVNKLVANVSHDFGVQENLKVEAQLYKMLLYEKGSFFKMHRDSEKVEGMFATLVIILPSVYAGGELVVKHTGDVKEFSQQSSDSGFSSQYVSFYADCQHELKEVTAGHRLCLVYNVVKVGAGPCPSAAENLNVWKSLRAAARAWGTDFDGSKLVIVTDHLYTPAGMKSGGGSANFKGKDAAIVDLLERAEEEGVDLDWDHGIVSHKESGYGESEDHGWGSYGFSWGETTDSDMSLTLQTHGNVPLSQEEEMIPEDFYEDKDADESFKPTGNEGVNAERQYADENAIVVWPRSRRWEILAGNDPGRMCDYLLGACKSEPTSECKGKAKAIIQRVLSYRLGDYTREREEIVSKLMRCLVNIDDKEFATEYFLKQYLASQKGPAPNELLPQLPAFTERFGCDAVWPHLLACIDNSSYTQDPNKVLKFAIQCWQLMGTNRSTCALSKQLEERILYCMAPESLRESVPLKNLLTPVSVRDFLSLCVGEKPMPDSKLTSRRFIEAVAWASCQQVIKKNSYSYSSPASASASKVEGPRALCNAGVVTLCETHGWESFEGALADAVKKLSENGSLDCALSLVKELAYPAACQSSERYQVCSTLADQVVKDVLNDMGRKMTAGLLSDLFALIQLYCPSLFDNFVSAVLKLELDTVLTPLATALHKQGLAPTARSQEAATKITRYCAESIASRVSKPMAIPQSWAVPEGPAKFPYTVAPFLRSSCKPILVLQLAKKSHASLFAELRPLMLSGDIKVESYRPDGSGFWAVKISKQKQRIVPAATLSCNCVTSRTFHNHPNCGIQPYTDAIKKRKKDETTLDELTALLPPKIGAEVRRKRKQASGPLASKKPKAGNVIDLT
jgi:predicted 2-oxoglutarate/Fe(II)-dependent dioxygenase YbiX